jgi:hypothetical protein
VKVLRYLKANNKELDTPRFRDVTESAESAYRSRIIFAFVARTQSGEARAHKKAQPHILRTLDEFKKKSRKIHTPGKRGKQVIPTSAQLLVMDEQAKEEEEEEGEGERGEAILDRRIEGDEKQGTSTRTEELKRVNGDGEETNEGEVAQQQDDELFVKGYCCIFIPPLPPLPLPLFMFDVLRYLS